MSWLTIQRATKKPNVETLQSSNILDYIATLPVPVVVIRECKPLKPATSFIVQHVTHMNAQFLANKTKEQFVEVALTFFGLSVLHTAKVQALDEIQRCRASHRGGGRRRAEAPGGRRAR